MTCNRCGKEMTKERSVAGRAESWWCPTCGNTQTDNKPADDEKKAPSSP